MWILYQLLMAAALLLAGPFLLLRRGSHYLPTLRQRLGRYPQPPTAEPLWLHAVSVGEAQVAATLVRHLPETPLLVTTITPTGQARARMEMGDRATIAYLPFDLPFAVRSFFSRFRPRALILVEGDLWPLVLRAAKRRGLPTIVVNGRVSDRAARRMRRLRPFLAPLLSRVDHFAVQSDDDRRRLLDLGVPPDGVSVTGNLKYETGAAPSLPGLEAIVQALAGSRPILVAGSTMEGEEEAVLEAFEALGPGRALLILAPRHPERWDSVAALVRSRGLALERRSDLREKADVDVLLLDSMGELAALYRLARGSFIGGTLVPTGGHNPLEPARDSVAVAVGPSMENFRDMARQFDGAEAWARVDNARQLTEIWHRWLDDPAAAAEVGRRGAEIAAANRGSLGRTLDLLAKRLDLPPRGVA